MFGEERAGANELKKETAKQNIKAHQYRTFQAVFAYPKTSDVVED